MIIPTVCPMPLLKLNNPAQAGFVFVGEEGRRGESCASSVQMVPLVGVEPTCLAAHDFESCVSANSTTAAPFILNLPL